MPDRRQVLKGGALGFLAFKIGGTIELLTPAAARAEGVPYRTLSEAEAETLDAFGDTLLPGAREAGLSHYIDQQISTDSATSLLFLRYVEVPPPYGGFYKTGLAALDAHARNVHGTSFAMLSRENAHALVGSVAGSNPENWQGPPAPFFYFVTRADAVDVVYGTMDGFEKLGVPYMAHLPPETKW